MFVKILYQRAIELISKSRAYRPAIDKYSQALHMCSALLSGFRESSTLDL